MALKMEDIEDFDSLFAGKPECNIPDRSRSDFYCRICDAHMITLQAWESHILGKRHSKEIRKMGVTTKVKAVVRDVPSKLVPLLEYVDSPIVGLKYISELQRHDQFLDSSYTCYLCNGTYTKLNIVDHLTSTKHRMNFLKEKDKNVFTMINGLGIGKENTDQLAEQHAAQWEDQEGRGEVEVKVELCSDVPPSASWSRNYNKRRSSNYDFPNARYNLSDKFHWNASRKDTYSRPSSAAGSSSASVCGDKEPTSQRVVKGPIASQHKDKEHTESREKDKEAAMPSIEKSSTSASAPCRDSPVEVCEDVSEPEGACAGPAPQTVEQLQTAEVPKDRWYLNDQTLHGITDIDLFRDAGMLDPQTQLDLLQYFLIENPPPTDTAEECKTIFDSMKMLEMLVYESAMKKMSDKDLEEIVMTLENPELDPFYQALHGSVKK